MTFDISQITLLDGAMGTMLQKSGLKPGEIPELKNIENPEMIAAVHRAYIDAGSQVVYANTFGANRRKLSKTSYSVAEVVSAGVHLAKKEAGEKAFVALDIGPLGELLEPLGTLTFEEAYDQFAEMMAAGAAAGALPSSRSRIAWIAPLQRPQAPPALV